MKLWIKLPLAISISLPIGASAQIDNYTPYHELLAKLCPAKHLEWVSPGQLNDLIMIDFEGSLTKTIKAKIDRANDEKVACANVIAGATCENVSHMKAMSKVGLLAKFAKSVCDSGLVCRGQSDCDKAQP
jgi:hypothetical protein